MCWVWDIDAMRCEGNPEGFVHRSFVFTLSQVRSFFTHPAPPALWQRREPNVLFRMDKV